jgi:hypothetical protein
MSISDFSRSHSGQLTELPTSKDFWFRTQAINFSIGDMFKAGRIPLGFFCRKIVHPRSGVSDLAGVQNPLFLRQIPEEKKDVERD